MKKIRAKAIKLSVVIAMLFLAMVSYLPIDELQAEATNDYFSVSLNTTTPSITTGDQVRLNVAFGFSNLTSNYDNTKMVITIPNEMTNAVATASNMPVIYADGSSDSLVPVVLGNTITYTVPAGKQVEPGFAGTIELVKIQTASFYTLPETVTVSATLSATLDGMPQTLTDTVPIELKTAPSWGLTKTAQFPTYNEETYVRFRMFIQAPNQNGNLAAKSFVITDVLPAGIDFVAFDDPTDPNITQILPGLIPGNSATWGSAKPQPYSSNTTKFPAGSVSQSNNAITWTIPDTGNTYDNTSYLELTFWVKVADNILSQPGEVKTITNTGDLSAQLLDDSNYVKTANGSIVIIDSVGDTQNLPDKVIYFKNGGYGLDTDSVYFAIKASSLVNRSATIPINNFVIEDTAINWSESLTLKDLRIPAMNTGNDTHPRLSYTVEFLSGSTIVATHTGNTSTNRTYTAPAGSDGYRIKIATIPRGTGGTGSSLQDIVVGFNLDASKVSTDKCVYNRASFSYNFNGQENTVIKSSGCQPLADEGAVRVTLGKQIDNKKSIYQYNDLVNYSISYSNSVYSGKSAENVMFYDLLPKTIKFVPGTVTGNVDVISVIEDYKGSGRQMVIFKLRTDLAANTSGTFKFNAYVTEDVKTQAYTNEVYMLSDTRLDTDFDNAAYTTDTTDIDSDLNTTESIVRATTNFDGAAFSGILIVKEVKGDLDANWSRYPAVGTVSAGGQLQYRMTIRNLSNKQMNNINVIDILPYVGDTGVLVSTPRQSQWTPYLKAAIIPPPDVNITYSTSTNPNRGPIGRPLIGEASTTWLTTAPPDITSVRSIKLNYTKSLAPNETFVFTYDMVTPVGAPRNGEVAWNSFAMQARDTLTNTVTTPIEPKEVGIRTAPPSRAALTGKAWLDENKDGNMDAAEVGLNGILAYLLHADGSPVLDTNNNPVYTVTANDVNGLPGYYGFANVLEGDYIVEFKPIDGYGKTPPLGYTTPLATNLSDYNLADYRTQPITISAQDVNFIDAGFTLGKLGDFVFEDTNYNGIQDAGELGVSGITVNLSKDGSVVATTVTDTNGYYLFSRLINGTYTLDLQKPTFYNFSPELQGSDRAVDSDFIRTSLQNAKTSDIPLHVNPDGIILDDTTIDAGMYKGKASIAGTIWDDLKRDDVYGQQPTGTANETFIAGVKVYLYNSEDVLIANTTSDTSGNYIFTGLPADDYTLSLDLPTGFALVNPHIGSDTTIDSDFTIATKKTAPLPLAIEEHLTDIDAGMYTAPTGQITGKAFVDDDYNCLQGVNEGNYSGLIVKLFDTTTNTVIQQTVTNNQGIYTFSNVAAGTYRIQVENNTTIFFIGNPTTVFDQDIVLPTNSTVITNIPPGGVCMQYVKAGLGDYVWLDTNRNGLQDEDEAGLAGVQLTLFDGATQIATTSSDSNGYYHFDQVVPNKGYRIEVTLPSTDYQYTLFNAAPLVDNSLAVERSPGGQIADMLVAQLAPNTSNTLYDVGVVYAPASIGDYLFLDTNSNSMQDSSDTPLRDITVELYQWTPTGLVYVSNTVTNSAGKYIFTNLNPDKYVIKVKESTVPTFLKPVLKKFIFGETATDSDIDGTTFESDVITLASGEHNNDIDAGFTYMLTEIGDYIWLDVNRNGIQDEGDLPMANIPVYLYKLNDLNEKVKVRETTTAANGQYFFNLVYPLLYEDGIFKNQTYYVGFDIPSLYELSPNLAVGADRTIDNNFSYVDGLVLSDPIIMDTTNIGLNNYDIDGALEYSYSSIGDYVWLDANRNGIQDNGESPVEGVTLTLSKRVGQSWVTVGQTQTNNQGLYVFDALDPGTYHIEIEMPENRNLTMYKIGTDAKDNDFCPTVADGSDYAGIATTNCQAVLPNQTADIILGPGEDLINYDAGLQRKYAEIGDYVWLDINRNNQQDATEVGIPNIVVNLINEQNIAVDTQMTDALGRYLFRNVEEGNYRVELTFPSHFILAQPFVGDPTKDSDIEIATQHTGQFSILAGDHKYDIDAGLQYKLASVGDFIWFDTNENGLQDIGEQGIENITVTLLDENGQPALDGFGTPVTSVVTDNLGAYSFANLNPGKYSIRLDLTPDQQTYYQATLLQQGADATVDSNLQNTFISTSFDLHPDEQLRTIDVGLINRKASIGGYTWVDSNMNGLQDPSEPILPNVPVTLYNITDGVFEQLATSTTDSSGNYLFENLDPTKIYQVLFGKMTDYDETIQNSGDETIDSDMNQITRLTEAIYLVNGQNLRHIDGGFIYPFSTLGNYIWMDTNQNGTQDINETGVSGVKVELLNEFNQAIADGEGNFSQITDASGYYRFNKLHGDAAYKIKVTLPTEYSAFTIQGIDLLSDTDSNVDATGLSTVVTLLDMEHNMTVDAGLIPKPVALGDYIWLDKNKNGIQDTGEPGIPNVTVMLTDANTVQTLTTTDSNGKYAFTDLVVGTYCVTVNIPVNYDWTLQYIGNTNNDSNFSSLQQQTCVTLTPNQTDNSIDAGFIYRESSIGDYIWFDANENGIQDIGENGISGIEVAIEHQDGTPVYNVDGTLVTSVTTTSTGRYLFEKLPAGTYNIRLLLTPTQQVFYEQTASLQGVDTTHDSDFASNFVSTPVTIGYSEDNRTLDFGLINHKASIGGYTWIDSNLDGHQDAGETPLENVWVELYSVENNVVTFVRQMQTTATGNYLFKNIDPTKTYRVRMVPPVDYDTTVENAWVDQEDSDIDQTTGWTDDITVTNGQDVRHIDGGYTFPHSIIGDYVWMDTNENGIQDLNETGVGNVRIELLDELDQPIADGDGRTELFTDAGGYYRFNKLHGDKIYKIRATLPTGYTGFSLKGTDPLSNTDSNVDATGVSDAVTLLDGEHNLTVDVGLIPAAGSIGDYIWLDSNKDGVQDLGELGVEGVTINLYDATNTLVATTLTGAMGDYLFENIVVGTYRVEVVVPVNYKWTIKNATTSDLDSNFDSTNNVTVTLHPGENITDIDGGFIYKESSIGNYIWFDANENGMQDIDELGVAGIAVRLVNADNTPAISVDGTPVPTTTTDNNGFYQFTRLAAGSYIVILDVTPAQSNYYQVTLLNQGSDNTRDSDGLTTFQSNTIALGYDENNSTIDFGFINKRASLGDYTWLDSNRNGIQDIGESPLAGVNVRLYRTKNAIEEYVGSTVTDTFGTYKFENLNPLYSYRVYFVPQTDYDVTVENIGSTTTDSNVDQLTGWTDEIIVTNGEYNATIDAGYTSPYSMLGDYIWADLNADGLQNNNEVGVSNVKVELLDQFGAPIADGDGTFETLTNAAGYYSFVKLHTNVAYKIRVTLPTGYLSFSPKNALDAGVPNNILDSDVDSNGITDAVTLVNEEQNLTIDAGLIPQRAKIGNYIWFDKNKNGLQDTDETGIANVEVKLTDAFNNVTSVLTDTNGNYLFENLLPGNYCVEVIKPANYEWTIKENGDSNIDSNFDSIKTTECITLGAGEENLSIDAGVYKKDEEPVLPITGENQAMIQLAFGTLFIGCILVTSVYAKNRNKHMR